MLNERGFRILGALDTVAAAKAATPAQVALAWLLHKPAVTAPIASATSLPQFEEQLGAVHVDLDASSMDLLDKASTL
jgi:aryl-alcohol dehydrogenase-like predicted oxidoreductase